MDAFASDGTLLISSTTLVTASLEIAGLSDISSPAIESGCFSCAKMNVVCFFSALD